MDTLHNSLQKQCYQAILSAFPDLEGEQVDSVIELTQSTQEKFGHYQCNSAMRLSKLLKQNPRQIAQKIVSKLEGGEGIAQLEIAGPGFINLTLSTAFLSQQMNSLLQDERLAVPSVGKKKRLVIDFSSPNIAKEMHVGHLRSTVIGDSLARIFEFLGYDVLRLNHVGDWGTAFGMLITYLKDHHQDVLDGRRETNLQDLVQWYRESKQCFDEDEAFKKRAQLQVVDLQGGDQEALQAWKIICEISREAFQEVYDLLDVRLQERGESFYNPQLAGIIEHLATQGLIEESNGAKCVFLEGYENREGDPLPLIVQKSDGGYNYATTDLAALRQRVRDEKGDHLIYVTDGGQASHFQMVFDAGKKAQFYDENQVRIDHVPFGLVLREDGKKFRTRSGETERLIDLLNTAVEKAKGILVERDFSSTDVSIDQLAKALGIAAVKYADLSCLRTKDYVFSYDRMLKFEGNTAAFLMYAYVRVAGIKRKMGISDQDLDLSGTITLAHASEVALALHIRRFSEALESCAKDLLPNRLCDYLFNLAEYFNAFFRDCRVEGSKEQESRLLLCELVARTLRLGTSLLGLQLVDRM